MKKTKHWEMYWKNYEKVRQDSKKYMKFKCSLKLLPSNFKNLVYIGGGNGFFVELTKQKERKWDLMQKS